MKNTFVVIWLLIAGTSLTAQTLNTWKGGKPGRENDWNIAANWSLNRVPDWTQDVLIPDVSATTRSYPELAGMSVEINSLRIHSSAQLTIGEYASLVLPGGLILEPVLLRGFLDTRYVNPDTGPTALVFK